MGKKMLFCFMGVLSLIIIGLLIICFNKESSDKTVKVNSMTATVIAIDEENNNIQIQTKDNIIYTISLDEAILEIGDTIVIEYTGILDENKDVQNITVIDYNTYKINNEKNDDKTNNLEDNGIFSKYYDLANKKLETLSLDEKIGQLILARYPDNNAKEDLQKYNLGGYVFFAKDFANKDENTVKNMIKELQDTAKIPILTAVDEEGGTVVRVSSNPKLAPSKFASPRELYLSGGFEKIKQDTINKSKVLSNLGLNVNLAPVVDVSTNMDDYMYNRSLGEDTEKTKEYAKTVIEASKGTNVSYTLRHFPGYGNNADTHSSGVSDTRSYEDIKNNDLPPFEEGIKSGAEAVLVSHNTVTSVDSNNPASLSTKVHEILRKDLNFTGVIITDDLAMGAVSTISNNAVKAIQAGNDILITTDYAKSIEEIKKAIDDGTISEELIDTLALRVISWKYYKNLMFDNSK